MAAATAEVKRLADGWKAGDREGSRWIGNPPTPDEFAKWFSTNVRFDDGIDPDHYVQGITLIPQKEKARRVNDEGIIGEVERLTWTPYAKVETRLAYFWELCRINGWTGEIVPVNVGKADPVLGDGFSWLGLKDNKNVEIPHLACKMQVRVYTEGFKYGDKGRVVMMPPPATKIVKASPGHYGPDVNLIAKAETGAIGRALGMAGILVIPGSGVATADDMQEFLRLDSGPSEPALPPGPPAPESQPGPSVAELVAQLESEKPGDADAFAAWLVEKKIGLERMNPTQERVVRRKLEQLLA